MKQKNKILQGLISIFRGPQYKIETVKVGVKDRFRIKRRVLGIFWETMMNPLTIYNRPAPLEYKIESDAYKKLRELCGSEF